MVTRMRGANARLIAVAPDLLEVARQIAETSKYGSDTVSLLLALNRIAAQARATIAKAEGL